MFDRVWVPCVHCGNMLEFQSKAGDCTLADYKLGEAPEAIKADIIGDIEICEKCKGKTKIEGLVQIWPVSY